MSNDDGTPTEADAVRRVIAEGAVGDYSDIAAAVQRRFGLLVGSRLVEEVVMQLRRDGGQQTTTESNPPEAMAAAARPGDRRARVLEFVEEMGGFAEALSAINELESALKRLGR
jgi:hypothetical protein